MSESWPVAELDPVRRLRVLAASLPGTVYAEGTIDAPFDQVWPVASDLADTLPVVLTDVRWARVTWARDERLELVARGRLGQRARFDVVLRPGWCWMRSRLLVGGMAAVPDPAGTRFAFVGGSPLARPLGPLVQSAGEPLVRRVIDRLARRVHERGLTA